jgi:hypothetical protein
VRAVENISAAHGVIIYSPSRPRVQIDRVRRFQRIACVLAGGNSDPTQTHGSKAPSAAMQREPTLTITLVCGLEGWCQAWTGHSNG